VRINKFPGVKIVMLAGLAGFATSALAQDGLDELRERAEAALGTVDLQRLEFSAEGWEACLGQPWNISEGWARWSLTDYRRVIDYATGTSVQTATRQPGMDPGKIGGCGAQPDGAAVPQQSSIAAESPWATQMTLWMTPHGFLELAERNAAEVTTTDEGFTVSFNFSQNGVNYPVSGTYDSEGHLLRTETRIDNSVFGDMLVETRFGAYQDFAGVRFPASMEQLQGGFPVLSLSITAVVPDTTATATPPPRPAGAPGGGAGPAPQAAGPVTTALTPDIIVSNGAYQGVIVNQPEGIVVIDGLQSDARSAELIAQAKAAFPDKAIRYVIVTHNHFDHASGLRAFVAEGATIVTHMMNEEFFKEALSAPRTLENADPQLNPVKVLGVGDYFALGVGETQIELYRLEGDSHADDMLIAYLPEITTVVEADVLQPWISPAFNGGGDRPHPFLVLLADELERLNLPYTQFVPVHRPPQPPLMTRQDLMTALGR
jgi:glyoxylase-like metal-dependent hydrolase (beta-lactamase superfamily II)